MNAWRRTLPHAVVLGLLLFLAADMVGAIDDDTAQARRDVEVLLKKSRANDAVTRVEALVALNPRDARLQEFRGRVWTLAQKGDALRAQLLQLSEANPTDPGPDLFLAQLPGLSREQRRAHLQRSLARDPDYAPALLASWRLAPPGSPQAAALARRVVDPLGRLTVAVHGFVTRPPAEATAREKLCESLLDDTRAEEARTPGDPTALFLRAEILMTERRLPEADDAIEAGRHLAPADPRGHVLHARLDLERARPEKALEELDTVLRVTPRTPRILALEVRALLQLQRLDDAATLLADVSETLRPQHPEIVDESLGTVAWAGRDRNALAAVVGRRRSMPPFGSNYPWRRLEGYLAYLDGDLEAVRAATLDLPAGEQGELPRLRRALEDQAERRATGTRFVTVLSVVLVLVVGVGGYLHLRSRRTLEEANS